MTMIADPLPTMARFPEDLWPPSSGLESAYRKCVREGLAAMASRRAIICGLARNIESRLPWTAARLTRLGAMFADYRIVIYENDSTDNTAAALAEWAASDDRVHIVSERLGAPINLQIRCPQRGTRMAGYRNKYHDIVTSAFSDFHSVVVADTDLALGWSYEGIAHSFGCDAWDFMGSNSIIFQRHRYRLNVPIHFDAWAFREHGSYAPMPTRVVNLFRWPRGAMPVPVYSCFGGLGVYRMEAFLAGTYAGGDCEHVPFHRTMREAGFSRQYLNPSQITLYGRKRKRFESLVKACNTVTSRFTGRDYSRFLQLAPA